jgi:zinc transporter ZupT
VKPWGAVILAAMIVNLVTLIGVIFIAGEWLRKAFCPAWMSQGDQTLLWTHVLLPMFACGALLATTFFLVLPEGLELIKDGFSSEESHADNDHRRSLQDHDQSGEASVTWRFGAAILGGFLIPVIAHSIFPHENAHAHTADDLKVDAHGSSAAETSGFEKRETVSAEKVDPTANEEAVSQTKVEEEKLSLSEGRTAESDEEPNPVCAMAPKITNPSLAASIFLGDFFHNFADGVFIGTAFLLCDRSLAITITAATIFHELAQEIADYFMLVHHCGMSRVGALALNFVCGLSILLGGIVVLAADLSSTAVGVILCIGGGVYVHVAVADCLPTAREHEKGRKQKAYGILAFVSGAVPIGLVLLIHPHCEVH